MSKGLKSVLAAVLIAGIGLSGVRAQDFELLFKQADPQAVKLLRMAGIVYQDDWKRFNEEEKNILLAAIDQDGHLTPLGEKLIQELLKARLANPNTKPKEKVHQIKSGDLEQRSLRLTKGLSQKLSGSAELWKITENTFGNSPIANPLVTPDMFNWSRGLSARTSTSISNFSNTATVRLIVSPTSAISVSRYNVHQDKNYQTTAGRVLTEAGLNASLLANHQAKVVHALKVFNLLVLEVPEDQAQGLGAALEAKGHYAKPASSFRLNMSKPLRPLPSPLEGLKQLSRPLPSNPASLGARRGWNMFLNSGSGLLPMRRAEKFTPHLVDSVPMIHPNKFYKAGIHGENAVALIVDSGLDQNHPDFSGRQITTKDFSRDEDNKDYVGHGTHVASTALGNGEGSGGQYRGVAYGTGQVLIAKIFGKTPTAGEDTILAGLDWGVTQAGGKKVVINMSLGGDGDPNDVLSRAVNLLAHQGHAVIVAAGNAGGKDSVASPGLARDALTVAAADKTGRITDYSSRGREGGYSTPALDQALYNKPDVTAPGGGVNLPAAESLKRLLNPIWTPFGESPREDHCVYGPGIIAAKSSSMEESSCDVMVDGRRLYTKMSGTSMATPHVAGANLLVMDLLERNNAVTQDSFLESKAAQMESARLLMPAGPDFKPTDQGAGMLDLDRLYDLVTSRLEVGVPIGNISAEIAFWASSNEKLARAIEKDSGYKITRYGIINQSTGDVINTDAELDQLARAAQGTEKKKKNFWDRVRDWFDS